MTIAATLAACKALPGISARFDRETREYRITFAEAPPERREAVAAYTDDPADAIGTATAMSRAGYRG